MKAMIFAAGLGTRLKPLTDKIPKALVEVGGKPLLRIQIEKLKAAGINDFVVNIHHFAEQIREYIKENSSFGVDVKFSDESEMLLETGGGIKKAAEMLKDNDGMPFLVHNVDILSNVDIRAFMESGKDNAATLLVSDRKTQRYLLFDKQNRLVGWTNVSTGEIRSPYKNLDVSACNKYAFAGVHLFSPKLFPYFDNWPDKFSIIDFYLSLCDKEDIIAYPKSDLKLMDVGKLDTLAKAEDFLRNECC